VSLRDIRIPVPRGGVPRAVALAGLALGAIALVAALARTRIRADAPASRPVSPSQVSGRRGPDGQAPDRQAPGWASAPALDRARRVVERISADRARVDEVFAGPDDLTGVVVGVDGGHFIGWLAPRSGLLMVGALFDGDGNNLTQRAMLARAYAVPAQDAATTAADPPAPGLAAAGTALHGANSKGGTSRGTALTNAQLARALAQSAAFVEGDGGPVVTAFIDMSCPFCAALYAKSRGLVGGGRARMRWIPVAVIGPDSMSRAAAVLRSPDPIHALAAGYARAPADPRPPSAQLQARIAANSALLSTVTDGRAMTPLLLVQRVDGSFSASAGMPADLLAFAINGAAGAAPP